MPPFMQLHLWLIVTFFCRHFHFALPPVCCDNVAWQWLPRHQSCSHTSGLLLPFSLFLPPLPLCTAPCLPQQCRMAVATMPTFMQLHLWLIVTFFCCHFHLALMLHGSGHHATTHTAAPLADCYLFLYCCHFHFALPMACRDDVAWQWPPCHHSCSRTSR